MCSEEKIKYSPFHNLDVIVQHLNDCAYLCLHDIPTIDIIITDIFTEAQTETDINKDTDINTGTVATTCFVIFVVFVLFCFCYLRVRIGEREEPFPSLLAKKQFIVRSSQKSTHSRSYL